MSVRIVDTYPIRQLSIFEGLGEPRITTILQAAKLKQFRSESILFMEQEKPTHLHVLITGIVELFKNHESREYGLLLMESGDVFMPAAVLYDSPYLSSARTLTNSKVLLLPSDVVREEFFRCHRLSLNFSRLLAGQFRMATRQIIDLKCRSAAQRLAAFLIRLVDESAMTSTARLPVQKRRLAARLGMTPETLSRMLRTLANNGLVVRGTEIIVRDRALIEKFRGPPLYDKPDDAALDVRAR